MHEKFLKPYSAENTENRIYKIWEDSGFFNPDICIERGVIKKDAEHFSIVLPPPNVTGTLHTGHASMLAIEDTIVRYQRMCGKKTLWIPGTDHAAISTQSVVEKLISKEKLTRHDLGREEFLKRVNAFAQASHDTIVSQVRKMGASVDWSREAYTLDEAREKAVRTAFKKMYDDELIYRGYRIVNWDPKGQTTVSDDEVNHEERMGKLYTFKYSKDVPFSIATTRPETKLGDTAVAVHPDDPRYKDLIGKTYEFEFAGATVKILVVGDDVVDPAYGTGVVGVTPAHSQTDWEIGKRHSLPVVPVINEYSKMIIGMEGVKDKKTTEAREKIIEWLKAEGLFEKEEDIKQNIGTAERSGAVIEPLPKLQWFIDVNKPARDGKSLKELMLEAVRSKSIDILPDQFEKVYFHWIENLRDWNISRQIWFGHRIPVWYDTEGKEYVEKEIRISLVSHGTTEAKEKQIFSPYNTSMTVNGIEEVSTKAQELKELSIVYKKIYCSRLPRAIKTAEILSGILGIPYEIIDDLAAPNYGSYENKPLTKESWGEYIDDILINNKNAESAEEIFTRMSRAIKNIVDQGENAIIVGHQFTSHTIQSSNQKKTIDKNFLLSPEQKEFSLLISPTSLNPKLIQDEDTLDTWFSSGLWTFSTLGWPDQTEDFKTYHPTSLLETGQDILFFWVARMILMSTYLLGEVPFKTVYLHGMILDKNGKKMSKSRPETAVDPLETIQKYGADALRMAMIVGVGPGQPATLTKDKIKAYGKFSNKIWNATRFVMENTKGFDVETKPELETNHQNFISTWAELKKEITKEMDEYKLYLVGEKLYHFFWHQFADIIIEECKKDLNDSAKYTLIYLLREQLRALHPFMPFLTEEIWGLIHDEKPEKLLIIEAWPE